MQIGICLGHIKLSEGSSLTTNGSSLVLHFPLSVVDFPHETLINGSVMTEPDCRPVASHQDTVSPILWVCITPLTVLNHLSLTSCPCSVKSVQQLSGFTDTAGKAP
ncbi:hypothetical protein GOODEAATRI_032985 [Goodea atripinnis]|uniref:Uncharacterized protein n=1 Tax=Goodea atripinnis TaxID=208336 RepID=A0ABV0NQ33_9TELE